MKIAIAHDYVTQRGGAERVVLSMLKAFPQAQLHTLLYDPTRTFDAFKNYDIHVSPLNRIAGIRRNHRAALPVLPVASQLFKIEADVVLASTSGWAHGFDVGDAELYAYCYSPARWLYQPARYLGDSAPLLRRAGLQALRRSLIAWDKRSATRVDHYLAISTAVQDRIKSIYGRESLLLPAPLSQSINGQAQRPAGLSAEMDSGFYLCVSRLLPYKNVRQVLEGCRLAGVNLVIVGTGPEGETLSQAAGGAVQVLSDLSDAEMSWLYGHCQAVIAASYEDFGLTPLEGALQGKPSLTLRYGGYLDTVVEGRTGVHFDHPTPDAIATAITDHTKMHWSGSEILARAEKYSEENFIRSLREIVTSGSARSAKL